MQNQHVILCSTVYIIMYERWSKKVLFPSPGRRLLASKMRAQVGPKSVIRVLVIALLLGLDCFQLKAAATTFPLEGALACLDRNNEAEGDEDVLLESLGTLTSGSCMHFDEYRVERDVYPQEKYFSVEELQCLSSIPQLRACSTCYLCHHHLYHDHSLAAFTSALLSLQSYPLAGPSASCLGAVYFRRNNYLRASFYSSVSHEYNSSLEIMYSNVRNDGHMYTFMKENYRDFLFPNYQNIAKAMRQNRHYDQDPYNAIFADICDQLKGVYSLFTIYSNHLHQLPHWMVGPTVVAYESFLDAFENAVRPYTAAGGSVGNGCMDSGNGICRIQKNYDLQLPDTSTEKVRELLRWPTDKLIILHNDNTASSPPYLYDDYIQGLSDSLNRLGVPHKRSTVSPQQRNDDSVTIYINENVEYIQKNHAMHGQAEGSFHRYVQWNLEHPVDDICTSKHDSRNRPQCAKQFTSVACGVLHARSDPCQVAVWESSIMSLFAELRSHKANSDTQIPRLVNALCPEFVMLATKAEHLFATALLEDSTTSSFYEERDFGRPIDILVLGLQNDGRSKYYVSLVEFALQNHVTLKFFMDYEDSCIEQERHLIKDAKVIVNLMADNSEEANPASSSHLFKARQLLAMGKVVISESLDIGSVDEEVLSDYITFVTSENIAPVALALLNAPATRWEMEKNGFQYISTDHFQQNISVISNEESDGNNIPVIKHQPSSLLLLAEALKHLADLLWPAEREAAPQTLRDKEEGEAIQANKALVWAEKYCQQNSLMLDTTAENVALHNASHACHKKFRLRILLGYLKRRYKLNGKILWVGCEKGTKKYQKLGNLNREFRLNCVFPSPDILKIMLKKLEKKSFELIFINHEAIQYSYEEFQIIMPILMQYLEPKKGSVVINSMIPVHKSMQSETWKFLIHLKAFLDVDSALGAFDNGLLVLRIRTNRYLIYDDSKEIAAVTRVALERHEEQCERLCLTPSEHFFEVADSFVPILDFFQLHEWLSLTSGTVKLTAIPWDKSCLMPPYKHPSGNIELDHPIVVCIGDE